jgi:hypothetical protein
MTSSKKRAKQRSPSPEPINCKLKLNKFIFHYGFVFGL